MNKTSDYSKLSVFRRMIKLLFSTSPKEVTGLLIFYTISGIIPAGITLLWKHLYDQVYFMMTARTQGNELFMILFIFMVVQIIDSILLVAGNVPVKKATQMIKLRLMEYTHIKISEVPLELYENNRFYDSVARINDILNSNRFIGFLSLSLMILKSIISTISVSLVLASFNPWLILLCLLSILPPSLARIIKGQRYYYMTRFQTPKKRLMNYYITLLTSKDSVKELRIFNAQNHIRDKWFDIKKELQNEEWSFTKKHGSVQLFVDISRVLGFAVGIIICTVMLIVGQLTVGVFGAAITSLENVQDHFSTVLIQAGNIGNTLTQLRDLIEFYDIKTDHEGYIPLDKTPNSIQLKNVSFTYPDSEQKALDQISIEIKKGESISLLGMNGSGKSTLIKVMLGLYKPTEGEIYYDHIPLSLLDKKSVYKYVSVVFQDYVKYLLTVRENIGFGELDQLYNDDRINDVISENGLYEVVKQLPNGLDTRLGKEFGGEELSIGQWQRIAIARGHVRDSSIIVLDEPTASLDPVIEAQVYAKFLNLSKNKTSVIISHRVGSASLAHRILVMKTGKIIEDGSHTELMQKDGEYARLFKLQAQWYI